LIFKSFGSLCRDTHALAQREAERPAPKLLKEIYIILNAEITLIHEQSVKQIENMKYTQVATYSFILPKVHKNQQNPTFGLASAFRMLKSYLRVASTLYLRRNRDLGVKNRKIV